MIFGGVNLDHLSESFDRAQRGRSEQRHSECQQSEKMISLHKHVPGFCVLRQSWQAGRALRARRGGQRTARPTKSINQHQRRRRLCRYHRIVQFPSLRFNYVSLSVCVHFERANVTAIAARRIGNGMVIEWAMVAALIGVKSETLALVNRRTAGQ